MTSKILIPKSAAGGGYEIIVEPVTKGTPGRKRKLDHLSPDEKIQRKKLKNRVAAPHPEIVKRNFSMSWRGS